MDEKEVIKTFKETVKAYSFATHVHEEVSVIDGRADLRLPDYDVVIEAKGKGGDVKKAVGQVLWYAEYLDDTPYILIPFSEATKNLVDVCETNGVGIIDVGDSPSIPYLLHDVGGLEPFKIHDVKISKRSSEYHGPFGPRNKEVL